MGGYTDELHLWNTNFCYLLSATEQPKQPSEIRASKEKEEGMILKFAGQSGSDSATLQLYR
jgi:hypothetical protein